MKKLHIETYGCQMNTADSEVIATILAPEYTTTADIKEADLILLNTCSVRDNAEQRIHKRLAELKALKKRNPTLKIGVVGCMAERMKEKLLTAEDVVDLLVGPDAYRELPQMLQSGKNVSVELSESETYDDILPTRYDTNGISAFVSIMRGCQNYCSYCIVPYTRGKERSRNAQSILDEVRDLVNKGYKEVTLLGQNVNSYLFKSENETVNFAELISRVAEISPLLRVRFATSHPKDLSDELLKAMATHPNICRSIHLPVQSGSDRMLKVMNRKYTREWYLNRIQAIRHYLPDCAISTDVIAGFCTETEDDHQQTLSLFREVGYDSAFMFRYSVREGTLAQRHYEDDVPEETKIRRLEEIIQLQQRLSLQSNERDVGKTMEVLIEGVSKRSNSHWFGRNSQNKVVIFPKGDCKKGEYINVHIESCTSATLFGSVVEK